MNRYPRTGAEMVACRSVRMSRLRSHPFCFWCGREVKHYEDLGLRHRHDQATIDHMIPRSRGGPNARWNLKLSCWLCNHWRGNSLMPPSLAREAMTKQRQQRNAAKVPSRPCFGCGLIERHKRNCRPVDGCYFSGWTKARIAKARLHGTKSADRWIELSRYKPLPSQLSDLALRVEVGCEVEQ